MSSGADANLKRPIIWNGAIIGEEASLRACVIAVVRVANRRAQILKVLWWVRFQS